MLFAGLVAVVILAQRSAQPDAPAKPGPFTGAPAARTSTAFNVERVDGATLTVSGDDRMASSRITVPADARFDVLEPGRPANIAAGGFLTLIGVANEVRSFGIREIVYFPQAATPDTDGFLRTAGGFEGHEAERDAKERPILGGRVEAVANGVATLTTASGPVTVELAAAPPLWLVRTGAAGDIHEGDRIAFFTKDGKPDLGVGLILSGGAK